MIKTRLCRQEKRVVIRVLLIEDEIGFSQPLSAWLKKYLELFGKPEIVLAPTIPSALERLRSMPFSAIHIDLRMPYVPGGIAETSTPAGLVAAKLIEEKLPFALGVIWSTFSDRHPSAGLYSGRNAWPYWSKGVPAADTIPELPHYTADEGAEAITRMLALWPPGDAKPQGKGEVSWAERYFKQGRDRLPEQLSVACGHLSQAVDARGDIEAQAALPSVFEFGEWVLHWLWATTAALLRDAGLAERAAPFPGAVPGRAMNRKSLQDALAEMLTVLVVSKARTHAALWLRFLNRWEPADDTLDIIEAIDWLRDRRNDWAHGGSMSGARAALAELSTPFRLVMDAAAFLGAYPLVTEVHPAGTKQWRLQCVYGQHPWPVREWELDLPVDFRAKDGHVYQVWPREDGSCGLIDLWPFMECRADADFRRKRLWLALGLNDGRRVTERCFNDAKEVVFPRGKPPAPYSEMTNDRWQRLSAR